VIGLQLQVLPEAVHEIGLQVSDDDFEVLMAALKFEVPKGKSPL
jgi:hypothetical protein